MALSATSIGCQHYWGLADTAMERYDNNANESHYKGSINVYK